MSYYNWDGIPDDMKKLASSTYMRITSFSPRDEIGGIDREWIELKIAQAILEYSRCPIIVAQSMSSDLKSSISLLILPDKPTA